MNTINNKAAPQLITFLENLMKRRRRLPSQLARDVGVSHPTVGRWLSGEDVPSTASCRKLAVYGSVSVEKVLSMSGHLPEIKQSPTVDWPEFREYAHLKYPNELDEDIIIMIEDLIERRREKRLGKQSL
jgi:transcriptional regulator with XRE-family HTH domain